MTSVSAAAVVLVSGRFIAALREAGCTGWATYAVTLLDEDGTAMEHDHAGLAITGRCGPVDPRDGEEIPRRRRQLGWQRHLERVAPEEFQQRMHHVTGQLEHRRDGAHHDGDRPDEPVVVELDEVDGVDPHTVDAYPDDQAQRPVAAEFIDELDGFEDCRQDAEEPRARGRAREPRCWREAARS